METKVVAEVDSEEWSRLLLNVKRASIFHTKEWATVLAKTYPRRVPKYVVLEEPSGEIVGGMPFIDRAEMGIHILSSMPLGTYGGPLLKAGIDEEVENEMLGQFCSLRHFPGTAARRLVSFNRRLDYLLARSFQESVSYATILSLDSSLDEIWRNKLHSKIRNQIRQSQQSGITIEISGDPSHLKEFYRMALETFKRHESKPLPFNLYQNIFEIMGKPGFVKLCLAKHENFYIAGSICFTFKDSVFYWMNVSYKKFWNLRPNNLIIWSMVKWAHENGFKHFNFGATPPEAGELKRFKLRWGSEEVPCYEYEKKMLILKLLK